MPLCWPQLSALHWGGLRGPGRPQVAREPSSWFPSFNGPGHLVLAFLMFPAAIFLMRRFSIGLKMRDTSLKITRTLAIENIPQLVGGLLLKP